MRIRKNEREALVALLEQDHEDVEQLANEVFTQAVELFLARDLWLVWVGIAAKPQPFGPFLSRNQALKSIGHEVVGWHNDPRCRAGVVQLISNVSGVPLCKGVEDSAEETRA